MTTKRASPTAPLIALGSACLAVALSLGVRSYSEVNATSFRIGDYESLNDASIDPYLATRDAYLQYRTRMARE